MASGAREHELKQEGLGRLANERWVRDGVLLVGIVLLAFLLPPLIYAYLVWRQFGFIELSGYVPYEELSQAVKSLDPLTILSAPVWSMNMTSGFLLSNMYTLTVGQFLLTLAMGLAIALNLLAYLNLRNVCSVNGGFGAAGAAGTGLLATVGASSTGIMGCCGSGVAGGVLALAGASATSASALAQLSTPVQVLFVAGFAVNWLRLRSKLRALLA